MIKVSLTYIKKIVHPLAPVISWLPGKRGEEIGCSLLGIMEKCIYFIHVFSFCFFYFFDTKWEIGVSARMFDAEANGDSVTDHHKVWSIFFDKNRKNLPERSKPAE